MATVVGVFRHGGDAQLAAEHLLEEYALTEDQMDVIGPGDAWPMTRPGTTPEERWVLDAALAGIGQSGFPPGEDPVARRWSGAALYEGKTLVVARSFDEEIAAAMAEVLHRSGAEAVDMLMY